MPNAAQGFSALPFQPKDKKGSSVENLYLSIIFSSPGEQIPFLFKDKLSLVFYAIAVNISLIAQSSYSKT